MTGLLLLAALAAADAPDALEAFFAEFAAKRECIQVLEARFTQDDVLPEETLRSTGTVVYVKGGSEPGARRIVFRYEEPDEGATYLIDGRRLFEYQPIKQLEIYDLGDNPQAEIFFLGFDDNTEALRKTYNVTLFAVEDEKMGAHGVSIEPKPTPAGADAEPPPFREVRLFLREGDYLPVEIHIVNDEDAQEYIRISDVRVNHEIDPEKTQIALLEGTKIFEDDEYKETVGSGGKRVPAPIAPSASGSREAPEP